MNLKKKNFPNYWKHKVIYYIAIYYNIVRVFIITS